jgi:hypothetical protein
MIQKIEIRRIMIKLIISICTIMTFQNINAQDNYNNNKISKNSIYFELLGSAGYLYNISYDRIVLTKGKNHISTGLGFQYTPFSSKLTNNPVSSLSPQINYFYGIKHHFETGLGLVYYFNSSDLDIPIRIGYRFQKPEGGLLFKVALTPLLTKSYPIFGEGLLLIPWGGIAIGWTF